MEVISDALEKDWEEVLSVLSQEDWNYFIGTQYIVSSETVSSLEQISPFLFIFHFFFYLFRERHFVVRVIPLSIRPLFASPWTNTREERQSFACVSV